MSENQNQTINEPGSVVGEKSTFFNEALSSFVESRDILSGVGDKLDELLTLVAKNASEFTKISEKNINAVGASISKAFIRDILDKAKLGDRSGTDPNPVTSFYRKHLGGSILDKDQYSLLKTKLADKKWVGANKEDAAKARAYVAQWDFAQAKTPYQKAWRAARVLKTAGGAGMFTSALGGLAGGAALSLAIMGLKAAIGQLMLTIKENTKVILGGSFAASRTASGAFGYFSMRNSPMTAGDYMGYRSNMRLIGMRNDGDIERKLVDMSSLGIFGSHGRDAMSAAYSSEVLKRRMGLNIDNAFLQQMNIATGGSNSASLKNRGALSVSGLGVMLGRANVFSQNQYGAALGTSTMFNLVKQMTSGLLGMNNNIGDVIGALAAFSKKLTEGKLTTEEFTSMWKGVNENMSQQNMMNLVAFAGTGAGHGNILENMYDYLKNTRNATGKVLNWRLAAQTALKTYREQYGSDTPENRMKAMLDNGVLDIFGLGSLKKNPEWVTVLEGAAAGSVEMTKKLEEAAKSESDILQDQSKTLDAIREPVAHMRDLLFSKWTFKGMERLRENMFAYNMDRMGVEKGSAAWKKLSDLDEKKAEAERIGFIEAIKQGLAEQKVGMSEDVIQIFREIRDNTRERGIVSK